ncbi:SRPBCC family protein [Chloroflexota bacterium]
MRFESSADIDASPEMVWMAVSDPEDWPLWVPSLQKVEKLSPVPLGVGSRLYVTVKAIIKVKLHMTITEFVPENSVVMQGKVLCTRLVRFYRLEGIDRRTRLVAGGEARGPLAWVVSRSGRKLSEEIVEALKKRVEEVRV